MRQSAVRINVLRLTALAAFCILFVSAAAASDFDGEKPLLCAITSIMECTPDGTCQTVSIQEVDIPRFLEIGFEKKEISEVGFDPDERRTPILGMEKTEANLILQGAQNGRGWSMTISKEDGEAVISVAGDRTGFVLFGACTPR
jgi:hypothetical protein